MISASFIKYSAVALAAVAIVTLLTLSHKAAVNNAAKAATEKCQKKAAEEYNKQLTAALAQQEQDWTAAAKRAEKTTAVETEIKEVARDVIKEVVYVSECRDLGAEWLRKYNAVPTAAENSRKREEGLQPTATGS